jgi:hypothetical protein
MKTNKSRKRKGLRRTETEWMRSQKRRAILMAAISLLAGAAVIAILICMARSAV